MKSILKYTLIGLLTLLSYTDMFAQTPITVCGPMNSFTGMTRGYHFTAPTTFTVCGIYVEDDMSTLFQSVAIVRFTAGPPPAFAGTTNSFVTLFQNLNYAPNNMVAVPNITINAGDIIGVYGSRGANSINSYGSPNCGLMINGFPANAQRSGMQFDLAAGPGMHDIWSEVNYNIGRVTLYTNCCPQPPAITSIAGPTSVCEGDVVNYTCPAQTGAVTYNWTLPAGATVNSGQGTNSINVTWNVATPPDSVCVTWDDSCTTSPSFCMAVTVNPIPVAPTALSLNSCPNTTATLTATAPGGTYEWFNVAAGGSVLGTGSSFTTPVLTTNSTFYVQTTVNGCTSPRTPVNVTLATNQVDFTSDSVSGCMPLTVNFNNTTDPGIVASTFWDFGDGGTDTSDSPTYTYYNPGTYGVSLTVIDTLGCSFTKTNFNYINVFELPTANFTMNPTSASMFDPNINFYDESFSNIVSWNWDFGGTGFSNNQNPEHTFPSDTGTYLITLTVTNANGCIASTTGELTILGEHGIYIPNAFTPDGDGRNDVFGPKGFGISETNYAFRIFNRWGEVIFISKSMNDGWDGTYKGVLVPSDVYAWRVDYTDILGKKHKQVGHVTMIK
ncbi:MAG: PKD domain-containing protein [Vicingaceae bacterium]|nr:PKD domain-containing protein [Vicingaceae bacterium]